MDINNFTSGTLLIINSPHPKKPSLQDGKSIAGTEELALVYTESNEWPISSRTTEAVDAIIRVNNSDRTAWSRRALDSNQSTQMNRAMDNMFRLSTEASKIAIDFTDIHHVLSRAGMGVSVFGKATGAPFLATQKALRSLDKMIPQSPKQFERVLVVIRGAYTSLTSYSDTCALIDSHPRITDKTLFLAGVIDDEDMKDIMEVNLTVTWHPDHAA